MLDFIEINSNLPAKHSVIWLHGLGADGQDFVPIVPQLQLVESTAVRFIFPNAPMQPVTINNGMVMRAWYDIFALNAQMREDEIGIRRSANLVSQLIEQEHSRGIPYEKIFLAGFSQGGALALFSSLRFPHKLAGVITLSAYLPLANTLSKEANVANKGLSIFLAHGLYDTIVPVMLAQFTKEVLMQDYQVSWHTYPIDHSACLEEIKEISEWLKKRI